MYKIDFQKPVHVHFIGIGGISMSGLAEVLLDRGFNVSGSDRSESQLTRRLEEQGAAIFYGQCASNIKEGTDLVVYTAAIHPDNPEYKAAADAGIPMLTRAELLGQLMTNYRLPIAVSGTHGKTTTTSMISHLLLANEADPTISVGGILPAINGNIRVGAGDIFLTEACEYTNSFLDFFPKISIILNIDADHLDFFKDLDDIRRSFRRFAELLPADGTLIINRAIPQVEEITKDLPCRVIYYGLEAGCGHRASAATPRQILPITSLPAHPSTSQGMGKRSAATNCACRVSTMWITLSPRSRSPIFFRSRARQRRRGSGILWVQTAASSTKEK